MKRILQRRRKTRKEDYLVANEIACRIALVQQRTLLVVNANENQS